MQVLLLTASSVNNPPKGTENEQTKYFTPFVYAEVVLVNVVNPLLCLI